VLQHAAAIVQYAVQHEHVAHEKRVSHVAFSCLLLAFRKRQRAPFWYNPDHLLGFAEVFRQYSSKKGCQIYI
jgi:hypothetical protein